MENTNMILVALLSGILGAIAGAFLMYRGTRLQSRQQLEVRLQQAEQKLKDQQAQVTEHFTHTASLVGNLTRNYRDLHDYLASSAQQLGNIDIQPVLLSDNKSAPILGQGAVLNPPLDYAPKKGQVGTLSETYGLQDDNQLKPPPAHSYNDE
ncbi:MAG TPA: DUF1043 family protein [Pseudomonadales bacterium]|nr:DUF1043 family protein [Pseudomonadales bacterium]